MFRNSMPSGFLLLMTSLAAATPAQAADVTNVSLDVTIASSSLVSDDITVAFRVTGTGLNNGTLTQPIAGAAPITLKKDGLDLILEDDLGSEAELNTFLPDGNYVLRLNNDTVQATLVYARPLVPSPAIAEPDAGEIVPPGPIEVLFVACPVCNLTGDSVLAELEDDQMATLDEETLTSTSASWIPEDGAGDLALPEQSAFVARVTHMTVRQANTTANDDDNTLVFTHHFVQSDEVGFETGFHTPEGHFCLAANYAAPPPGCELLTDPLLQVLDTSGVFAALVAGHDLETTVSVASNGALSGAASADLDDNGSLETSSTPIKGKLAGKSGALRSKLSFALNNSALPAKLKLKLSDMLSVPGNTLAHTQAASGTIGAAKIQETTPSNGALPFPPLGWLLEFDIDAMSSVQNALLTLEGGRAFSLAGTNKFKVASGQSSLKLQSADKGIRVALKKIVLDDATNPMSVTGGAVSTRILGQIGNAPLP